jgi:hypothetical protein
MTIEDWRKRIDRQFEAGLYKCIQIGERKTHEITNFEYCLIPEVIKIQVGAPVPEEIIERQYVINATKERSELLLADINSRQAAFVNDYDGEDNHCISYFHYYIRDNKICMNVYVRSMDYKRNFIFDNQTFNLAYKEAFTKLKQKFGDKVEEGYIRVFVFSLHVYS